MPNTISQKMAIQRAIDTANHLLGKFFPNERMCPRLKNWLYICLVRNASHYHSPEFRQTFVFSPSSMLSALLENHINDKVVARIRAGGYIDESRLKWLEGTDVFLSAFEAIINKLNHPTITPIAQNASNLTICLMMVDGMAGDHVEKESTLTLAREEWLTFKEIINIFTWARKDKGTTSIVKIRQAAQELGVEGPIASRHRIQYGYWPGFVSYIFSLDMNRETAKSVSSYAKTLIRQSTREKTIGKGQVNVLIDTDTIKKLEKICRETKLSKAKLITALINNYGTYNTLIYPVPKNTNIQPVYTDHRIQPI